MKSKYVIVFIALIVSLLIVNAYANSQSSAIIELNGDGSWEWIATLSPVVITSTPAPSQTPWIVTATVESTIATPTQETTLPPIPPMMTPTPTAFPTHTPTPPPPDVCFATVLVNLRIREDHTTDSATIGFWSVRDRVTVSETYIELYDDIPERIDEWALVTSLDGTVTGWSAALYNFSKYITYDNSQACLEVRFPDPDAALLWHTVPGFNIENARISHSILANKNIEYGYKTFADINVCIETLENGGTCIYRHGNPDCPQNIGAANPRESARDFLLSNSLSASILTQYSKAWYEPINECWYGDDNRPTVFVWWAEWLDEFILTARDMNLPPLVIPTLGPGHGSILMFQAWKSVLEKSDENGGLFGEHAYTPYHDDGLCSCDEWLACRHRTNEAYRQSIGLNIRVAITEAARGWGNDPVDVDDFVCWYEEIRHDTFLHSVALWTAGYHPTWPLANLDAYMVPIAQRVN